MSAKTVCIDPGHGGGDPGAVGPGGTKESAIVLDVGLIVENELKRLGIAAVMTRRTDHFLTLAKRVEIANEAKAEAFVSIHCNSAARPARGVETFVARRTKVSFPLAEAVQDWMTDEVPDIPDRGIKRANFYVLRHTKMAACLAELDFIHTPAGEADLNDADRRLRYGVAIARGVAEFLGVQAPITKKDPDEPKACGAMALADYAIESAKEILDMATLLKR